MLPTPTPPRPILRWFLAAAAGAAAALVVALMRSPPPQDPPELRQALAQHHAMLPAVAWADPGNPDALHAELRIDSVLDGRPLRSTLYRLGRDPFTLHCAPLVWAWPRAAVPARLPDRVDAVQFESSDVLAVGWHGPHGAALVLGDLPPKRLREAASKVECGGADGPGD